MINIHKVTDLNIERSEDWTCLEVVTNEMTRHHYELARLIAKDYDNIDSFDIAVIMTRLLTYFQHMFYRSFCRLPLLPLHVCVGLYVREMQDASDHGSQPLRKASSLHQGRLRCRAA